MSNNLMIGADELYSAKTGNTPRRWGRAADGGIVATSPVKSSAGERLRRIMMDP